ncbi:MAG TPA: tRNA (adenosine(37)-N6)-dimethylallyltransferase MiaA [Geopsychrobacteraceae bacterium]|nr:tRNA (adenosine(37)-N6)-dimethylallyltransferase MiaA [Geopsychrobacteraceae bacterium]
MSIKPINLIVILGPTASGKTGLAVAAAHRFNGEIISADSRQVFRGMDLGTGKDLVEYGDIPYHLIDIADPGSEFNVYQFQKLCFEAIELISARNRTPVICGGTGLYLEAVLQGYRMLHVPENLQLRAELAALTDRQLQQRLLTLKPEQHNQTDLSDRDRLIRAIEIAVGEQQQSNGEPPFPELNPVVFGLRWPRPVLRKRIALRLQQRLDAGMIDEVARIHAAGVSWQSLEFYGLEYRLIAQHLQKQLSFNDMKQKLQSAIGQFAKRQDTWFRRMERRGVNIIWLEGDNQPFDKLCNHLQKIDFPYAESSA